ncbi:MAG: ATP-dependent DNA helicase RecG [Candidatus Gottesmanbacteria bacterium GW2011_GWC2_42_8]|nr:MAG: ATP-dependent DNA helicase RecG [Candidatus Gottesmanbacteria bacterium GW2011_GWC2_42_8]
MIGPYYQKLLEKLSIRTIGELLYHAPFRYDNYSLVSKIAGIQVGETVSVEGKITDFKNIFTRSGKKLQKAKLADETGEISLIWFNQTYLASIMHPGTEISVAGQVKFYERKPAFLVPQYEIIATNRDHIHTAGLIPVYPETAGLTSKWLRTKISILFKRFNLEIPEFLPPEILEANNLPPLKKAMSDVHFPKTLKDAQNALRRLAFEELLIAQLASLIRKKKWIKLKSAKKIEPASDKIRTFINKLPFRLTGAQEKVLEEIFEDVKAERPMNRLLSGDVGSGKTIVAVICMYAAHLSGLKSVLLAPTEILAKQHFISVKNFLVPYGLKVGFLSGKEKEGSIDDSVVIGTHALLYNFAPPADLGLVIIDEQHRFGVEQRAAMRFKGKYPHILSMTATPIPHTIALTLYSDLNLSHLDQMPKDRLPVKTYVVPPQKREAAYQWVIKKIKSSRKDKLQQVFVLCPFIEPSESLGSVKSAKAEYKRLKNEVFQGLNLGLLHGRLKSEEKSAGLRKFKNKEIEILVATPIVEVGIDFPDATIILIEAADRFGLAQLHQLRGRVGRGNIQSYCLLFSDSTQQKALDRLSALTRYSIGQKIAEYDLKLRGPGEFFGTVQHGNWGLKFADFRDLALIKTTRTEALNLFNKDHSLSSFPLLREKVLPYTIKSVSLD